MSFIVLEKQEIYAIQQFVTECHSRMDAAYLMSIIHSKFLKI